MFLKRVLPILLIVLALSVGVLLATDFTITVTVDTAMAPEILATVTAWRNRQFQDDGVTPKYANNTQVGQALLYDGLRRILRQQCEFDPVSCPPTIKSFLDARNSAQSSFDGEIDNAVQP